MQLNHSKRPAGISLVVCRDVDGLVWLKKNIGTLGEGIVVASDSPEVQSTLRNSPEVREVCFIEKMESLYEVSDDVIGVLDRVNDWLLQVSTESKVCKEIMFWQHHCEGGETTQRIQDGLLLVRSYQALIDRYAPSEVWLINSPGYSFEDEILVACAQEAGAACYRVGRRGFRGWFTELRDALHPVIKEVYCAGWVTIEKIRSIFKPEISPSPDRSVAFQVCGQASKKVLNVTTPVMQALDSSGFESVALCWSSGRSIAAIRSQGLRAIPLEAYVTWRELLSSWWITFKALRFAKQLFGRFLNDVHGRERLLRKALWTSMGRFFVGDVPRRFRLYQAMRRYWKKHPTCATRLLTRVMPEAVIAFRAFPPGKRPLLIWQPGWPYQLPWPYKRREVPVDYVYALSEAHLEQLHEVENIPLEKLMIVGMPWMATIMDFKKQHTKRHSRNVLNVPNEARLCIFIDAFDSIRGYLSRAEQMLFMNCMLEFAICNADVHFLIKARPSPFRGLFEEFFAENQKPNMTLIPRSELPYHALNASDIIITKFSTLTLEGMILGVPSIGAILDGEQRFAFSDDAIQYVYSVQQLEGLLARITKDQEYYFRWRRDLLSKAERFVSRHVYISPQDSTTLISDHLASLLLQSGRG